MGKPLTELTCRECKHCVLTGWWDRSKVCEISGFPVNENEPACISFVPRCQQN